MRPTPPTRSKSRNVNGYVQAELRRGRLAETLDRRLEALAPLRRRLAAAADDVRLRRARLTGGQLAEAERLIRAATTPG